MESPPQRVSPVIAPKSWVLPGKPEAGNPALDAFRQTEFQLKSDLRLLHEGMNLALRVVADSYPAKFRTHAAAAVQLYWSRLFHACADAALLIMRGSYVSVPPLVRTACECHAAAVQLGGDELPEFLNFLTAGLLPHERLRATDLGRGIYHAGTTLVAEEHLGRLYRVSSELARPYFGATMLAVAPESNRQKLQVTFGDQAFHFGWAQLELGWLVTLCSLALRYATGSFSPLERSDETRILIAAFLARADAALEVSDRCRIEEVEDGGAKRLLVSNFRRQSGGAPRKIAL